MLFDAKIAKTLLYLGKNSLSVRVKISHIWPNPFQPRRNFNAEKLKQLGRDIRKNGQRQPIAIVSRDTLPDLELPENCRWIIQHGERRWRAAKLVGLESLRAEEGTARNAQEMFQNALGENIQRENLSVVEEAYAYLKMAEEWGMTHHEIADRMNVSRTHVSSYIRYTELPEEVQQKIEEGTLTKGHAKQLLRLRNLYGGRWRQQTIFYAEMVEWLELTVRQLKTRIDNADMSEPLEEKILRNVEETRIAVEEDFTKENYEKLSDHGKEIYRKIARRSIEYLDRQIP